MANIRCAEWKRRLRLLVEARTDYPDSDGDGSVDPIDSFFGMDDDPAPGAHPSGWQLPYGTIQFRVKLSKPGARAVVVLQNALASSPMPDAQYWKYGSEIAGSAPGWYHFSYDEESVTGAKLGTTQTALGIRQTFSLFFLDGARGDSDGGANGTITDPGALVLNSSLEGAPVTQPGVTTPSNDVAVRGTTVIASPVATSATLPVTGSYVVRDLFAALALILCGIALSALARNRRLL